MIQRLGVDQPVDGFERGDTCRDEDRRHNGIDGPTFPPPIGSDECKTQRDGGQGVTGVVDEVRQQGHRAREREHDQLKRCCHTKDREARSHHPNALTRSDDGRIDEAVRVSVLAVVVKVIDVGLDRSEWEPRMAVRPTLVMFMGPDAMPVGDGMMHRPIMPAGASGSTARDGRGARGVLLTREEPSARARPLVRGATRLSERSPTRNRCSPFLPFPVRRR